MISLPLGGSAAPNFYSYNNPASIGLSVYSDTTGRTQESAVIDPGERTFVAICEGQSLAGNHQQGLYTMTHGDKVHAVNTFGDRLLYRHAEPMLGASYYNNGYAGYMSGYGSIWGEVGDKLIDGGVFDRIIFCNVSYGGIYARDVAPSGQCGHRIFLAFNVLRSLGILPSRVDAVLSMLGESDSYDDTPTATFVARRLETVQASRNYGFTGKWFIPTETYSFGTMSTNVSTAQASLVDNGANIYAGPNIDAIDGSGRYTQEGTPPGSGKVHLNNTGRAAASLAWYNTLAAVY